VGNIHKSQNGFSAIEALLILIIVAIIGGTGWYVYNSNKNTNNIYNSANQSNQSAAKVAKAKPKTQATSSTKYIKITELGIQIPLASNVADLAYSWDSTNSTAVLGSGVLMQSAVKADPQHCSGSVSYPVAIITADATYAPSRTTANVTVGSKTYYWALPGAGQGCAVGAGQDFQNQLTTYANSALEQFKKSSNAQ
jgi:Tfp pilus assembly protein PilV